MALGEGSVLGGYRIVRLIGRGGMGAVYLADDVRLGRKVALKVLAPETAENPAVRGRFVRESHVAASLDHPHILPIYEAGEADGQLFIAMRYVPGPDLDGVVARDGPLPLERTVAIVEQISSALDAAHAAGLIHRDVKPGNILVAAGSTPGTDHAYLTDFGLTKHAEYSAALTRSGQLLGSVGYVAPEVIENRPIDGRVDIYSLGCVLYECLAGSQPYPRDTEMATLYAHVQAPAPSIAGARPELPAAVDAVIAKAMAKAPEARYQSGAELARALTEATAPEAAGRHLTRGFLFADLRGYTAYVEAHGDEAGAALLDAYRRLVRDVVRRSGGAEIKTEGDSFYVVFPSASEAVRCGLAITAAAATASTQDPARPIAVGVGIHAGETAETAEGYVGSAVNLAARICAQATAGEVLVSDTVRGLARTSSEVSFVARGRKHLKGIAEPIAVFAAALASTDAAVGGLPPRRPGTTSVAAFGMNRRRRAALAIAGAVAGIALGAWLIAAAMSGGLRASPGPSFGTRASQPLVQAPQSIAASPAPYGVIAFVRSPDLFGQSTSCDEIRFLGQGNILIMRDDGSDVAPVTSDLMGGDASPAVSPDGTSIAFVGSDFRFRAATLTGANRTDLSVPGPNPGLAGPPPSWSPDGRQFAYVDHSSDGTAVAYIANADGSDPHLLWQPPPPAKASTPFRLAATGPTPGPKAGSIEILAGLDWMHDGRVALLISTENVDSSGEYLGYKGAQLVVITSDGKTLSTLATSLQVAGSFDISPDGSRIAISGSAGADPAQPGPNPPAIDVMNVDGTNVIQLTHDSGPDEDPVWSPDGSQIAFSSWHGDGAQIDVVPRTGGQAHALTQSTPDVADCQPSWRLSSGPLPSQAPIAKGDASDPLNLGLGAQRPGTYASTPFKPTFQIDLPAGWEGVNLSTDGLYLWRKSATRERLWVSQVQVVFAGDCISSPTRTIGPTALDFVNWIRTDKDLRVGTVYPTSVGGANGLSFEVSVKHVPGQGHCQPIGYKSALYPISNDQVALQIDDVANFLVLDVNGTRVVLTLFGTQADLTADSAEIAALLGSIRFP